MPGGVATVRTLCRHVGRGLRGFCTLLLAPESPWVEGEETALVGGEPAWWFLWRFVKNLQGQTLLVVIIFVIKNKGEPVPKSD